jgi:phosphoserine phosphatase
VSQVLVLTAAADLPDAAARRAAAAAGAGPLRRLGAGAAEAALPDADPERLAAARAALAGAAADANALPAAGREKRLLLADMDSTIIGCECIDEIADFAGVKPQVAAITEAAMRGELDFEGALRARVALLEGLPVGDLDRVFAERVRLNPGAATLARTMAARGAVTALVSGGFTFFAERVARAAGFAIHRANTLLAEGGRLTGRVAEPILGRAAKAEALAALCAAGGFGAEGALAVGDGANDLAMVEAAGLGAAYRAKPALAEAADVRLDHADLTALLHMQGVPEADWVRA